MHFLVSCDVKALLREAADRDSRGVHLLCSAHPEIEFHIYVNIYMKVKVAQSCLTLCNLMDCSPPGSSVHGILQARIVEWVAVPFSRGSSQLKDRNQVSHIAGGFFTS